MGKPPVPIETPETPPPCPKPSHHRGETPAPQRLIQPHTEAFPERHYHPHPRTAPSLHSLKSPVSRPLVGPRTGPSPREPHRGTTKTPETPNPHRKTQALHRGHSKPHTPHIQGKPPRPHQSPCPARTPSPLAATRPSTSLPAIAVTHCHSPQKSHPLARSLADRRDITLDMRCRHRAFGQSAAAATGQRQLRQKSAMQDRQLRQERQERQEAGGARRPRSAMRSALRSEGESCAGGLPYVSGDMMARPRCNWLHFSLTPARLSPSMMVSPRRGRQLTTRPSTGPSVQAIAETQATQMTQRT